MQCSATRAAHPRHQHDLGDAAHIGQVEHAQNAWQRLPEPYVLHVLRSLTHATSGSTGTRPPMRRTVARSAGRCLQKGNDTQPKIPETLHH